VAALGVAGIVVYVSAKLGRRAVGSLIDEISPELLVAITKAAHAPGVLAVQHVRARQSGPETFVDLTICISREASFEQAHEIAAQVEEAVQSVTPQSTVVVHMDPVPAGAPAEGFHSPMRRRERRGFHSQNQEAAGKKMPASHLRK
jgi:divalent metal cation (Fe/Co/Zn/Cd) transporter